MVGKAAYMETNPKSSILVRYHYGIDSAMMHVSHYECYTKEEFVSK